MVKIRKITIERNDFLLQIMPTKRLNITTKLSTKFVHYASIESNLFAILKKTRIQQKIIK